MYYIAICDDEPVICAQFEKVLADYRKEEIKVDVFYSGEELYEALQSARHYDLVFLDIELGKINGVEVGRMIRDQLQDEQVQIVYISSKQEYAMELFEVRPMNFLVKPIQDRQILMNTEKAMRLKGTAEKCFEFKYGTEYYKISYGKIIYFESQNRKIIVHTDHGEKELYSKLDTIEKMCPENFIRIHQSYLINNGHIEAYKPDAVAMSDGDELSISKKYKKAVNTRMLKNGGVLR